MNAHPDPHHAELVRLYQQAHEELHHIQAVLGQPAAERRRDVTLRLLLQGRMRAIREIQETLRSSPKRNL